MEASFFEESEETMRALSGERLKQIHLAEARLAILLATENLVSGVVDMAVDDQSVNPPDAYQRWAVELDDNSNIIRGTD